LIIARGHSGDDKELLLLGLSRANINKLLAGYPIRLRKETHEGVPERWDVVILFGETEADLANLLTKPGEAAAPDESGRPRREAEEEKSSKFKTPPPP
jgi:hypothetical protein